MSLLKNKSWRTIIFFTLILLSLIIGFSIKEGLEYKPDALFNTTTPSKIFKHKMKNRQDISKTVQIHLLTTRCFKVKTLIVDIKCLPILFLPTKTLYF